MTRIAGIFSAKPTLESRHELEAMLDRLHVSTSKQSLISGHAMLGSVSSGAGGVSLIQRGSLGVVMDGRIFNAGELSSNQTASPAEVFLDLYGRYGFKVALERINGDFAVALHDATTDTLWLGRDRVGVKPLYYASQGGTFSFASQLRGLLGLPGISRKATRQFVALFAGSHYRTFDNDPEASPFADIKQLPAGHFVEVKLSGVKGPVRYWTLQDQPDFSATEQKLAEEYRELLIDAVRLRYAQAQSPAFTLSGGMDSSSVLASAVRLSGAKQHAFSSVYDDLTYDESAEIRSMLEQNVSEWHPIRIDPPDIFAAIREMVHAHDEPVATATWLSHFLLCKEAAQQGFGSFFGGLGGDELNAGEYEYFFFHFADIQAAGEVEKLKHEIDHWVMHHDHPIFRKNTAVAQEGLSKFVDMSVPGVCRPDRRRLERYANTLAPGFFDLGKYVPVMDNRFTSYLKNRTFQDIFRETAPCCLRAEDRQTGHFGLEHFDPFFDYRLMEFMFRVPGSMKIRNGVTKILLREATQGLLPEETRTRVKKTGWNAPAHKWFTEGAAYDGLRDMIGSRAFRERGIYNVTEVERIIDEHRAITASAEPRENHMMFLWQLVNLETWMREYQVTL